MQKTEFEASNLCAYSRFKWGSDGYAGKLNTMDLFGATLTNPVSVKATSKQVTEFFILNGSHELST